MNTLGDKNMCKIYAYMRVSTTEKSAKQDYERQMYLLEHSGIKFDKVFEVRGNQREKFNEMLELLNEKDQVCFTETSRFGRNYIDCFEMLDIITQQKKASVLFLSNGIELEGGEKLNPYQWLTISQFFLQDEFLKRQIGYNTANALRRKKEQGIVLGRPTRWNEEMADEIRERYDKGETLSMLSDEYGVSIATVSRIINKKTKD